MGKKKKKKRKRGLYQNWWKGNTANSKKKKKTDWVDCCGGCSTSSSSTPPPPRPLLPSPIPLRQTISQSSSHVPSPPGKAMMQFASSMSTRFRSCPAARTGYLSIEAFYGTTNITFSFFFHFSAEPLLVCVCFRFSFGSTFDFRLSIFSSLFFLNFDIFSFISGPIFCFVSSSSSASIFFLKYLWFDFLPISSNIFDYLQFSSFFLV